MPGPFTFPAWDLSTASPLDPLPYTKVTFGRQVNGPGPWGGQLALTDERVQQLAWNAASKTGKTLLCVDMNGVLVWGGIIWSRSYQKSKKVLVVGAAEIGSYFRQRLQAADYTATWVAPENPMLVVKRVMEDALAKGTIMGGITLSIHEQGTIPKVAASFPGTSLQTIESIVSTLSQMGFGAGFDYSFDVAYKPGTTTPEIVMNLWYPRQGRSVSETGLTLLDKNMLDWYYPEDSSQQATEVIETGSSGPGIVPATASVALPGYPLLQRTMSRTQVLSEEILAEIALGDLGLYCWPLVTPWVELALPGPMNPGEFQLGDDVLWRVDPVSKGENSSPRWPEGMESIWRMGGWAAVVPEQGLASLHLDLTTPPLSTIPPPGPPL